MGIRGRARPRHIAGSVEFESDELGFLFAGVGQGVGVGAGEPLHVAGLEVSGHGALAFDVAADFEIRDRYYEMRAGVVVAGDGRAGLQVDLGDADAVLHEHDVLGASGEDVEAAVFVPCGGRRFVGGFVLHEFDGDVAEWCVGEVMRDVGEVAGSKSGFAILQFHFDWRLAFDFIREIGGAQRDIHVVMAVDVHQRGIVRRDLDLEDAHILVFEREVMMLLGGDLNLGSGLRG